MGALAFLVFCLLYKHIQIQKRLTYYEKQGMRVSTCARSFLGNVYDFIMYDKLVRSGKSLNSRGPIIYIADKEAQARGEKAYDGGKDPAMLISAMG